MSSRATVVVPATGAVLDRILDTSASRWGRGLTRHAYGRGDAAEMQTTWGRAHRQRVALMDGAELLASAMHCRFSGILDQRSVQVCGIGRVLVDPRHLGHGHARTLVEQMVHDAASKHADLAILFPGPDSNLGLDAAWHSRLGFEGISIADVELAVASPAQRGAPMALVRGGEDRDLAAIVAMGKVRAAPFRFHLDRDSDLVRHAITRKRLSAGLGPLGASQLEFFIVEEGITAAAYVVISIVGRDWTLEECGDRDTSGARVGALLQALIARDTSEHRPTIRGRLPLGFLPPQVTVESSQPGAVMMVRTLGPHAAALNLSSDDVFYWRDDVP